MDGISLVQARIATIQARFAPTPAPPSPLPSAPTVDAGSFEAALTSAQMAQTAGTSAATPARNGNGSTVVPAELTGLTNGKIPESTLTPIGIGNHRLSSAAATAFTAMRADAATSGVEIGVTDSYRSLSQQVDVARRKGLYSQGGLAAQPGTSNHGWGLSVDIDVNDRGQEWLRANGARYGFVEDVAREPWHWTYRPDQSAGTAS